MFFGDVMPDQVEGSPEVQGECYENHYTHQTLENRRKSVEKQSYYRRLEGAYRIARFLTIIIGPCCHYGVF